jgi:excisionase family DNA binding protein
MTGKQPERLLTPGEASRILRVHPKTITMMARRGAVRSLVTPGGHVRVFAGDVETLAAQRVKP